MPHFSAKASNLIDVGPILDIQVAPTRQARDAMRAAGETVPQPETVSAMFDTGATGCVIQQGIAARLNLHPIGSQPVNTPTSQNVQCLRFLVVFQFPPTAGLMIPINVETVVMEAPLQGQHIQCLLGRDFMAHGILVYSGPDNSFSFSI